MLHHADQESLADVHFDVTQEERIERFLEQFAPSYKGYILDQTPRQLYSKEFMIRIYYQAHSSITLSCYSAEMLHQRILNLFNINRKVKFINTNPLIEEHTFSMSKTDKKDITVYYTATLEFEFVKN